MYQFENIKITEGNAFSLLIPLRKRTYVAQRPIDEDINILNLQSVVVKFGGVEYPCTLQEDGVLVDFPADLKCGTYDLVLTADYMDNAIRAAYFEAVTIVSYNYQSDAHNFVQGSPIVMQPAFVIYNLSDSELEALKIELREKIADAEEAKQAAEQAKEEFVEKAAMLDNVAQQGANPLATLSATQAAVEALAPVAQAAQAYNTGKTELAINITAKGVPASADETLPELAEKVSAIAQNSYTIDGGELYAKQLFGSLTTPNYWNLYEVLEMLLSDGRLVNYGGILLAEYYKGYDSLALSGAGAGGAYVVSDMENGVFKMYTEDTTHTWATEFDGKGNRWVAYCFADEYHDFQITDTNTSPRSIFIGRKVGTITSLVNGRVSQVVVPDGNLLSEFNTQTYTQNFASNVILRNLKQCENILIYNPFNSEKIYVLSDRIDCGEVIGYGNPKGLIAYFNGNVAANLSSLIIKANYINSGLLYCGVTSNNVIPLKTLMVDCETFGTISLGTHYTSKLSQLKEVHVRAIDGNEIWINRYDNGVKANLEKIYVVTENAKISSHSGNGQNLSNLSYIYLGYETNDKSKSVSFIASNYNTSSWDYPNDLELKNNWCKPLNAALCTALTEANMYAHILQRLKQDEEDCGDGVTITLGSSNLAKLTSAESIALLDSLTNTYGYTFA